MERVSVSLALSFSLSLRLSLSLSLSSLCPSPLSLFRFAAPFFGRVPKGKLSNWGSSLRQVLGGLSRLVNSWVILIWYLYVGPVDGTQS